MARKRTTPAKKKEQPELLFEDGYYWIVTGRKRENVGRNYRLAVRLYEERK